MKDSALIVLFPGAAPTHLVEVGGKAASLIRLIEAGLPVPSGAVLATTFFTPWFDAIKASATWTQVTESAPEEWEPLCRELKHSVPLLPLTVAQQERDAEELARGTGAPLSLLEDALKVGASRASGRHRDWRTVSSLPLAGRA